MNHRTTAIEVFQVPVLGLGSTANVLELNTQGLNHLYEDGHSVWCQSDQDHSSYTDGWGGTLAVRSIQ